MLSKNSNAYPPGGGITEVLMSSDTVAEALAKKLNESGQKLGPDYGLQTMPWESLPDFHKGFYIATAGEALAWMGLLGLHVRLENGEIVVRAERRIVKTEKREERVGNVKPVHAVPEQMPGGRVNGFEGDPCPSCGAMMMVRNGSCLKCTACGETTGCS